MAQLLSKLRRIVLNDDPNFCDMFEDERARRASVEYLVHIRRHLQQQFHGERLTILDAGCQAGRLLIPLAGEGHRLIGIDASSFAIGRARRHVSARRLDADLHIGSIGQLRRWIAPGSLDVALCIEVLYLCPEYREFLQLMRDSLKPGGLLCISHRGALYYIAGAVSSRRPEEIPSILSRTEGPLLNGAYYNWFTESQLVDLYRSNGLELLEYRPVDIEVMRLDVSQPIAPPEAAQLLRAAQQDDASFCIPSYLLAIARRPA